jgi:glutamine amidotransferase-like uncharacterized protein
MKIRAHVNQHKTGTFIAVIRHIITFVSPFLKPNFEMLVVMAELFQQTKRVHGSEATGALMAVIRHIIIFVSPFLKPNFEILLMTAKLFQHTTKLHGSEATGIL